MSAQMKDAQNLAAQNLAMRASQVVDTTPGFSASSTCPLYHGPALYMLMPAHALAAVSASLFSEFALAPFPAFERIAAFSRPNRAHAVRGPPASNPS
jgi:hypothetical protein